jgi:hypothetical protein
LYQCCGVRRENKKYRKVEIKKRKGEERRGEERRGEERIGEKYDKKRVLMSIPHSDCEESFEISRNFTTVDETQ